MKEKIKNPERATISLNRHQANLFINTFKNDLHSKSNGMSEICEWLESDLAPLYVYKVKCTDCVRVFEVESKTKLDDKRVNSGGICMYCSDDYK
jgi:hypothetical protein